MRNFFAGLLTAAVIIGIAWLAAGPVLRDQVVDQTPDVNLASMSQPLTGEVIDFPGGLYLNTVDGWMVCRDFETSDQECSSTGPVVPVNLASQSEPITFDGTAFMAAESENALEYPGTCRVFVGKVTVFSCSPSFSPEGMPSRDGTYEDGSAAYIDGWSYDAESGQYYR